MSIEFNENHLTVITQIDERSKSNSHRLDEAEADIKDLKEKNNALFEIRVEQGEMKSEISDLKNAPNKTKAGWVDNIGKLVITSIVTGIVAFLLGNCFPQIFG